MNTCKDDFDTVTKDPKRADQYYLRDMTFQFSLSLLKVTATNHDKHVCFLYLLPDTYFSYVKEMTLSKVKGHEEVNI